jgi:hypothetical protein
MASTERFRAILEVEESASIGDLQRAYRQILHVWNPERFAHDPELRERAVQKCREADQAFEALVTAHVAANDSAVPPVRTTTEPQEDFGKPQPVADLAAGGTVTGLWRTHDRVVVQNGGHIDGRCVRCGQPVAERLAHPVSYLPSGYYLLLFLGLIGWIIMAVVYRRGRVQIGLCATHAARRRVTRRVATAIGVFSVAFLVVGFMTIDADTWLSVGVAAGPLGILVALIIWALSNVIRATDIRDGWLWIKGVHPSIVENLPQIPGGPVGTPITPLSQVPQAGTP